MCFRLCFWVSVDWLPEILNVVVVFNVLFLGVEWLLEMLHVFRCCFQVLSVYWRVCMF